MLHHRRRGSVPDASTSNANPNAKRRRSRGRVAHRDDVDATSRSKDDDRAAAESRDGSPSRIFGEKRRDDRGCQRRRRRRRGARSKRSRGKETNRRGRRFVFHRSGGRAGLGRVADEGIKPDEVPRAGFEHHLRLRDAFPRADDAAYRFPTRSSAGIGPPRRRRAVHGDAKIRVPEPIASSSAFCGLERHDVRPSRRGVRVRVPAGVVRVRLHLEGGVARRGETDGMPSLMGFAHVHLREPGEKIAPAHPERAVVGAGVAQLGAEPRGPHLAPCAPLSVPLFASPRISYAKQSKRFAVPRRGSNHDRIPVPIPVPVPVSALRDKRGEFRLSADGGAGELAHFHHRVRVTADDAHAARPRGASHRKTHLREGEHLSPRGVRVQVVAFEVERLCRTPREIQEPFGNPSAADGVVTPVRFRVRLLHERHPELITRRARVRGGVLVPGTARTRRVGASRHLGRRRTNRKVIVHEHAAPTTGQEQTGDVRARGGGGGGERGRRGAVSGGTHDALDEIATFGDDGQSAQQPAIADGALANVGGKKSTPPESSRVPGRVPGRPRDAF